jgi:response regulator of citrate/malate metabolism
MTGETWGQLRQQMILATRALGAVDREIVEETMEQLDKHFANLKPAKAAPKPKSTGRPKLHIDLAALEECQRKRMSLREMGKSLKVSRETIRRILAGKRV